MITLECANNYWFRACNGAVIEINGAMLMNKSNIRSRSKNLSGHDAYKYQNFSSAHLWLLGSDFLEPVHTIGELRRLVEG